MKKIMVADLTTGHKHYVREIVWAKNEKKTKVGKFNREARDIIINGYADCLASIKETDKCWIVYIRSEEVVDA